MTFFNQITLIKSIIDFKYPALLLKIGNLNESMSQKHFFCGLLSTLTSLFQRQRSMISVSLKLSIQKNVTFLFLSSLI